MTDDDDNWRDWRDLTDQLTREQIANLEQHERRARDERYAVDLLEMARELANRNMIERIFSSDPLPPDSTWCGGWRPRDEGYWSRSFTGTRRVVDGVATLPLEVVDWGDTGRAGARTVDVSFRISVTIEGEQLTDGTVERSVSLNYCPDDMSVEVTEWEHGELTVNELALNADAARRLAAALAEAADELERLARP